jgi:hypothetical protein
VVDLVGEGRVQVSERIVGKTREVDHRVEAGEVGGRDVAHVRAPAGQFGRLLPEPALAEPPEIEADHVVACGA